MTTGKSLKPISWRLRIDSESDLGRNIERMLKVADHRMDSLTPLIETEICSAIVLAIDCQPTRKLNGDEAIEAARALMAFYPSKQFNDPDVFMAALAANFEGRDINIVRRVLDPKIGLPSRHKFVASIAETIDALNDAERQRFKVRATAQWMLDEHERRRRETEERKRWDLTPEELERRKAQVAELLKGPRP